MVVFGIGTGKEIPDTGFETEPGLTLNMFAFYPNRRLGDRKYFLLLIVSPALGLGKVREFLPAIATKPGIIRVLSLIHI